MWAALLLHSAAAACVGQLQPLETAPLTWEATAGSQSGGRKVAVRCGLLFCGIHANELLASIGRAQAPTVERAFSISHNALMHYNLET